MSIDRSEARVRPGGESARAGDATPRRVGRARNGAARYASSAPVLGRVRNLALLEFINIPLIAFVLIRAMRMPLTAANVTGLALVLVILAEGGAYWWLKLRQYAAGAAVPAGMGVYRVLLRANIALLVGGAAVVGAGWVAGGSGAEVVPGALLWVFAVLEHVNYFHIQLAHDNRADVSRLLRTGRLRRSHLARDLARSPGA